MFSLFSKRNKDLSNCVFDWDAYYRDIEKGMAFDERMKKMKNFDYWVDKSVKMAKEYA